MADPDTPLFLQQRSYRRRRLIDLARILPYIGLVVFNAPILFFPGNYEHALSGLLIYIFAVWFGLLIATALISRVIASQTDESR